MTYFIALTVLLAPAYIVRFKLLGLPTNFLMFWIFLLWLVFIFKIFSKTLWSEFIGVIKGVDRKLLFLITVFFISGIMALFWQGFSQEKLGQFIVLFLQPMSLFFIASFEWHQNPNSKRIVLYSFYLLLGLMGLYAAVQYFTLFGLPPEYWGNGVEPKRAIAFFSHPNFYSLFSAPLLAFLLPDALSQFQISNPPAGRAGFKFSKLWKPAFWLIGAIGLLLSLSRAGWLGLGVAGLVYLFVGANKAIKKFASIIIVITVIVILSVPNLRWRFALPFYGEKSAVSRLSLWQTGWKGVMDSPILGLGLTGFSKNWNRLNTDPNLDSHNFPHNIFLNLWVETGLLGLIGMIGLIGLMIYRSFKQRTDILHLGIGLFLIALSTQGLIDNPYFKNDLAIVFWIVLSMAI